MASSVFTTATLVLGIVALAVLWFAILWVSICYMVAKASGWSRLRLLCETGSFAGPTSTFSGYVGRSRLRGSLIAGATPSGLYLNVTAPFRIFVRPVLIPWHHINVSPPGPGPIPLVTFDFPDARTGLRVREDVATQLLQWQRGV